MFAGHFGVAAVVKSKSPQLPIWALLVGTQLLDLVFIPFSMIGVESIEPIGEGGYGKMIIHAFYSHSLVGALLLSFLAGGLAWRFLGKKSGLVLGAVTFSHWILDLIVHRPDMPILPGNAGNLPLLGFGLWEIVPASMLLEFLLIMAGACLYFSNILKTSEPKGKSKGIIVGCIMALFLFLSFGMDALL